MQVTVVKNYQKMSEFGAAQVVEELNNQLALKKQVVFLPSAGKTPTLLYKILAEKYKKQVDWARVTVFQMDEYYGLAVDHPASFSHYLRTSLIEPLLIKSFININNASYSRLTDHEDILVQAGGIDVALHGIGTNGHIGFNEPGSSISSGIRLVELDESTRIANTDGGFSSLAAVPKQAVTLGLKTLVKSKKNILIASGESKRNAVSRLINEEYSTELPASALTRSNHLHVIADSVSGTTKGAFDE